MAGDEGILASSCSEVDCRPVRPEDDKRSAPVARQVTERSAESVPPRGLKGRGGERPFSECRSARSAVNPRERGSEMSPENMLGDILGLEIIAFENIIQRHALFWRQ